MLNSTSFGAARPYEKLTEKVAFALDPKLRVNQNFVNLKLASRNPKGEVAFTAHLHVKTGDTARGNGRLSIG